jgi:hypothetical protein
MSTQHVERVKHCPVEYCEVCEFWEVNRSPVDGSTFAICRKPFETTQEPQK